MSHEAPTILIAEDEIETASVLQSYLTRHGFRVLTTASGQRALVIIEVERPDVVVLDFSLEDMNGQEVLRTLRGKGEVTPVVVITGQLLSAAEIEGIYRLGVAEYFIKPLKLEKLRGVLERLTHPAHLPSEQADRGPGVLPECSCQALDRETAHRLLNLLGVVRNKCENFLLSYDEGLYRDRSDAEITAFARELVREVNRGIDEAVDVVRELRGP